MMATITTRRGNEVVLDVAKVGKKIVIACTSTTIEMTMNEADILIDKLVDAKEGK